MSLLKSQLKELMGLPGIVSELQSQLQRVNKDIAFLSDSQHPCSSDTQKATHQNATMLPITQLPLSNRFIQQAKAKEPTSVPVKVNSRKDTQRTDENRPHDPPSTNHYHSHNCPNKTSIPPRESQTNIVSNQDKKFTFYIRKVPKDTAESEVHIVLDAAGVSPGYVKSAPTIRMHASRIYLEVSLSVPCANKLDKFLKTSTSLDWFLSVSPPKERMYPVRSAPIPTPYNQPTNRTFAQVVSTSQHRPLPTTVTQQPFRPIPPLMSLR